MIATLIASILSLLGIIYSVSISRKNHTERLALEERQEKHRQAQEKLALDAKIEAEERARAMDAKLDSKFSVIVERQMELEKQFYLLNESVTAHVLNSEVKESFEAGIGKATDGVALDIIKGNFTIGTNVKSMIIKWGSLMNKLAKAFHNSDTRKEEEDGDVFKRGELLLEQRNLIVSEFNNFVNSKFPNMKTSHKREKIRFSDLLINERVYNSFDILIAELEANGLSDKEYVKKFEIQSRKFCKNLLVALEVWNSFEASVIFNKEKEDAA